MKTSKKTLTTEKQPGYHIVQKKVDELNAMLSKMDLSFVDEKQTLNKKND